MRADEATPCPGSKDRKHRFRLKKQARDEWVYTCRHCPLTITTVRVL